MTAETTLSEMPLEFDPFSDEYFGGPYALYRRLRDQAPVFFSERYGFWALFRYDDVCAAHKDWQNFSSAHGVACRPCNNDQELFGMYRSIIMMDLPEHDRLRALVSRVSTPKAVAGARTDDPRGHRLLPRALRGRRLVRRRGRVERPVPGRDHLAHARRAGGGPPADPALARHRAAP